ncbi:MAG: hypothetical protein PHC82_03925 [Candidatus Pacebacteria bacterium]|nr:hypothetical protein [Candidatus Paceibacterota bacterium]
MMFEHYSKNKKTLFFISLSFLFIGIAFFSWQKFFESESPISCTAEARLCPDGSYVGRVLPNCDFAECPPAENFKNPYMEKAIADYLLTQNDFSWKTEEGSYNFCTIKNLDPEKELFPLYIWAHCGEYVMAEGELENLSGSSGPLKIDYPNELSYYDLQKFSYEAPRDGSYYSEDIKKIFPEKLWDKIFNFNRTDIIKQNEAKAKDEIP